MEMSKFGLLDHDVDQIDASSISLSNQVESPLPRAFRQPDQGLGFAPTFLKVVLCVAA
jgi:hypothetical protein